KIDGIRLWSSLLVPNADGIDITSSFNVVIANSDIRTGDDAIAVVSYSHHFEIPGYKGIKKDCETKLKTGYWWGNGEPIHISAVRCNPDVKLGQIKNVNFSNIICEGENGILVYGSDENTIENLCFKNVTFKITDSKLSNVAGGNIDLRGQMYAHRNIFSHDIPALYASKVKELTIDDFKLQWDTGLPSFFTNGILVNDFKNLKINNFQGSASPSNSALKSITLKDGFGFKSDVDKSAVQLENVK
ncbi:MAG: hypothetical protein H7202_14710, partial [Pedobacter sp.]|nr:hypothetical protein [Pedobacter sp.]